jgi:hypothetical protein
MDQIDTANKRAFVKGDRVFLALAGKKMESAIVTANEEWDGIVRIAIDDEEFAVFASEIVLRLGVCK